MHILIVEDEWIVSEEIRETLLATGFNESIDQADRADQALDIMKDKVIDLAILDIVIKGEMDGLALGQRIREDFGHCHLIFLSSYYDERAEIILQEINPLAIINKPFNAGDLIQELRKIDTQ